MLSWTRSQTNDRIIHSAEMTGSSEQQIRQALESCADKAIALLDTNIQDDSLYLLFEWNLISSSLSVVVTDASKTYDASESIYCSFTELARLDEAQKISNVDSINFWLHDYLTTCTAFFRYSLVAIFHSSTRNNTELL